MVVWLLARFHTDRKRSESYPATGFFSLSPPRDSARAVFQRSARMVCCFAGSTALPTTHIKSYRWSGQQAGYRARRTFRSLRWRTRPGNGGGEFRAKMLSIYLTRNEHAACRRASLKTHASWPRFRQNVGFIL
jgi:hypothetical protein